MKKKLLLFTFFALFAITPLVYGNESKLKDVATKDIDSNEGELNNETVRQEKLKQKRQELEKAELKRTKKTEANEVKDTAKEQRLEKIKKEANKKIDSAIKKLNGIKERVAKMSQIPDDDKLELNTKIDERIALLEAKKTAVDAATTKEEVKAALDGSIKDLRDTKDLVKNIVDSIHKKHLTNIISKMSAMIVEIEAKLAKLTGSDKEEREASLALAKTDLAAAQTALDVGNLEEAKASLKKVHQDLKNALSKKKSSSDDSGQNEEEGVKSETN